MGERITAPFTDEQVIQLNSWQANCPFHPFTCGREHDLHVQLVATRDGWVCPDPDCNYTQDWAHDFMAVWVPTIGRYWFNDPAPSGSPATEEGEANGRALS